MRKKLPYKEGDWIAVPLRNGGYVVGRVARMDDRGGVIGYFFGPRRPSVPELDELKMLHPKDAVAVYYFGDLGLLDGTWTVIGATETWQREQWPIAVFVREEDLFKYGFNYYRVIYPDDKLDDRRIIEERISAEEAKGLPKYSVYGAGAVEIVLDKKLSKE